MKSPTSVALRITWSLMHPTSLDAGYFRRVLDAASERRVDSFEICGPCHGLDGGLDGLIEADENRPEANAAARRNANALREIVSLAHGAGKPVFLWHREVVLPEHTTPGTSPGLFDSDGDFDFFGEGFHAFIRRKIHRALEVCPDLDGIVLTLTEAQYSVIHPVRPDKFPPVEVVAQIASLFASELHALGKTFVLRSFGSTEEDYRVLLKGAAGAAVGAGGIEVETKVTPYDFVPFFESNPFLYQPKGCTLSVEFDGLGEFLGAGYFPAAGFEELLKRVGHARAAGARRFVLRIDRTGCSLLDASYRDKLEFFERAVHEGRDPVEAWLAGHLAKLHPQAAALYRRAWDATLGMLYIDGNLIFHTNPPSTRLKWLKAGGLFGVLHGHGYQSALRGIWSIHAHRHGKSRADILAEKRRAIDLANEALQIAKALSTDLPWGQKILRECSNLALTAEAIHDFVVFCLADLEAVQAGHDESARLAGLIADFCRKFDLPDVPEAPQTAEAIEHDLFLPDRATIEEAWLQPLVHLMRQLLAEHSSEIMLRSAFVRRQDVLDFAVLGGISDDWRIHRVMHASHTQVRDGRLLRAVGNPLFPNGTIGVALKGVSEAGFVEVVGFAAKSTTVRLDGQVLPLLRQMRDKWIYEIPPHRSDAIQRGFVEISGASTWVESIAILRSLAQIRRFNAVNHRLQ